MIEELIDRVIQREGGFVNHPDDRGGPTKYGITANTLSNHRGHPCSAKDVRDMPIEEARQIYYINYWSKPGFHQLNLADVVVEMLFDAGVHSGPVQAVRFLQAACGAKVDGHIGPKTLQAAESTDSVTLAANIMAERNLFLGRLITNNPSQAVFAHGWDARISELIRLIPQAVEHRRRR